MEGRLRGMEHVSRSSRNMVGARHRRNARACFVSFASFLVQYSMGRRPACARALSDRGAGVVTWTRSSRRCAPRFVFGSSS